MSWMPKYGKLIRTRIVAPAEDSALVVPAEEPAPVAPPKPAKPPKAAKPSARKPKAAKR